MPDLILDCKALSCPMPIVRLSTAMKDLDPGQIIRIEASDAAFESDLIAWAKKTGNHIDSYESGEVQRAVVRKR